MSKIVPYFVVLLVVMGMSIFGIGNCVSNSSNPSSVENKPKDTIGCSCPKSAPELMSLGKGVMTDVKITDEGGKKYIHYKSDGDGPYVQDYEKTSGADYYEIYGTSVIEEGKLYYLYQWGDRIVWSTTPKIVGNSGLLEDLK